MMAFRPIVLLLALLALSSCAYAPDNLVFTGGRCETDTAVHVQGVDWEKARPLNLRIRQGDFDPVYLGLLRGQSYVLAIENADDANRSFRAIEFFGAVAVAGVRVGNGEFEPVPCLTGVSIRPGEVTEIRLVAVRGGSYEFEDNSLMVSLAMVGSAGGFITIQAPRALPESPLESLQSLKPRTIEVRSEETPSPGLFDDQEEEPSPSPGLFDDQEEEPFPSPGLFDDAGPEQPIEAAPSMPVEIEQPLPELPVADEAPEPPPELPPELPPQLFDDEPDVDAIPEAIDGQEIMFIEEVPEIEEQPESTDPPAGFESLEGPPADIFSDPPDAAGFN